VLARRAPAARDRERDDDPVADPDARDGRADLDDLAHELVADDVAGAHPGDEPVVEMEVRATDRRRRDADDRVLWVEDRRIRHAVDADVARSVPDDGLHDVPAPTGSRPLGWPSTVAISPVSSSWRARRSISSSCAWRSGASIRRAGPSGPSAGRLAVRTTSVPRRVGPSRR